MKDKVFIDTNLIVYLFSADEQFKREKVREIIYSSYPIISTQVINEFSNVMIKKFKQGQENILNAVDELANAFTVVTISINDIKRAVKISSKYKFSFYDSLIISSALFNKCSVIYSEDLSNRQKIENLLIINPFI